MTKKQLFQRYQSGWAALFVTNTWALALNSARNVSKSFISKVSGGVNDLERSSLSFVIIPLFEGVTTLIELINVAQSVRLLLLCIRGSLVPSKLGLFKLTFSFLSSDILLQTHQKTQN